MAMTLITAKKTLETLEFPLPVGAAFIDPELIAPQDRQTEQNVEDLIAFRCSCI